MTQSELEMHVRSIKVNKKDIGYIRWCLESHDGIANPTTRMETPDILDLTISPHFLDDAERLIDALVKELGIERVDAPDKPPLL
ncbi:MAG: DUF4911 domain-containing protein [Deltaproteobacteria bacterium]|nr:DUF4911 domain-containing protein [Deltaproteobacteria bacterium]MBN2673150.1 DUF4911 domain-containing protein [Deltaproteobacteria bacterium]